MAHRKASSRKHSNLKHEDSPNMVRESQRKKNVKNQNFINNNKLLVLFSSFIVVGLTIYCFWSSGNQGANWALLVSGSVGYMDYRHEADICHAYHLLKRNGFKESNIIVFMEDLAANHGNNPKKGTLFHNMKGVNYYQGVIKDYVRENATRENLMAVLLGEKENVNGGSGKVIKSGPKDRIFFFYSDHGNEVSFQLPSPRYNGFLRKKDLRVTLEEKHALKGYKSMVIYINACRAGDSMSSISPKLNIYVMTSSGRREDSKGAYCPPSTTYPTPPPHAHPDYSSCLASQFGAAWIEHSEEIDTRKVTLQQQFLVVKQRVWSSTVHQYGNRKIANEKLSSYIGPL